MRIEYDPQANAVYLYLVDEITRSRVARTRAVEHEGINLDFSSNGTLIGIEVLGARARVPAILLGRALLSAKSTPMSYLPRTDRGTCTYCHGDDRSIPCAYPSEGKPGCLRDARLAEAKSPPRADNMTRCQALEALLREVRPYLDRERVSSFLGEVYTERKPPIGALGEIAQRIDTAVPPEKSPHE